MQEPKRTLLAATGLAAIVFAAVAVSGDRELHLSSTLQAEKLAAETGQRVAEAAPGPAPSRDHGDAEFSEAADSSQVSGAWADDHEHSGDLDALPMPCQSLPNRISRVDY